jgi:propionyl-CoA synthetase
MRKIADNEPYNPPATIDDPLILREIEESLTALGLSRARQSEPSAAGAEN